MKHVSVLVPEGQVVLSSVVGAFKLFGQANNFLNQQGLEPYYEIQLVGLKKETSLYDGIFSIHPNTTIDKVQKTDLIIVTTIMGNMEEALDKNEAFIPWIQDRYAEGAEVASLCMGAFLLAATGILNGKRATTHWIGIDQFREMFPEVILQQDKIITDEDRTYTSGGAYSFLNLLIYLIEKYNGRDIAILNAKLFEIDIDRYCQSEFVIFESQKTHSDESVQKVQTFMEVNFGRALSLDELADHASISRRNLIRRFKKATQNTPFEYLQRVRVEAAKKILERTEKNITEAMLEVGYSDNKAFRTVFKKFTGISPTDYRNKYNSHLSKILQ